MTEHEAVVMRLDGDHAWLDVAVASGCSSCTQGGCAGRAKRRPQRVRNTVGARVGQRVIVSVPEGAVLRATLWSYGLPLMLMLLGAASGLTLAGDAGAVAGTVAGLLLSLVALRFVDRSAGQAREPLVSMRIKDVVVQLHRNAPV
ncbi:MAG: SoxR reducing system RseC family protein [Rhodocyclaceae bacterium]|nr:SoxR reducing system RseC family protein [Rhodocyclaceae bacterium]